MRGDGAHRGLDRGPRGLGRGLRRLRGLRLGLGLDLSARLLVHGPILPRFGDSRLVGTRLVGAGVAGTGSRRDAEPPVRCVRHSGLHSAMLASDIESPVTRIWRTGKRGATPGGRGGPGRRAARPSCCPGRPRGSRGSP
ncbi:hypothetical protein T261_3510 [Streptomyces lydicus]|nr:hypothetical protein T261_3510 [Streptomyces lydicus]